MKKKARKQWEKLDVAGLARATAEFDGPVIGRTRAMNAAERARWKAAKGKRGRGK